MGRSGGGGRGGGGGGGSLSGNGGFGSDGTITEKQRDYVASLLTQPSKLYAGPMGAVTAAAEAHKMGGYSRLAESRATEVSMREFGPKLIAASDRWAASINVGKLSKGGASTLIDRLGGGRVKAFVATFGGSTTAARAKFMSKISGKKYVVRVNKRGQEEIWLK